MFKNHIEQRGSSYNTTEYYRKLRIIQLSSDLKYDADWKSKNVDRRSQEKKPIQAALLLQKLIKPKMQEEPKGQIMLLHRYL